MAVFPFFKASSTNLIISAHFAISAVCRLTSALPVPVVPSAARKALRAFAAACAILCTFAADGPVVFPPVVVFPLAVVVFPPVVVFPLAVVVFPVVVAFLGVVFPPLGVVEPPLGVVFPPLGVVDPPFGVVFPPLGVVFPPLGVVFPPLGVVAVVFPGLQTGIHLFISLGRLRSLFRQSPKALIQACLSFS